VFFIAASLFRHMYITEVEERGRSIIKIKKDDIINIKK